MTLIPRLQNYLRASAHRSYRSYPVPPFTMFINPHDAIAFFNYAIPNQPVGGDLHAPLDQLRYLCAQHERQPRFEFIAEYAPDLTASLEAAGFVAESRLQLMVCTRDTYQPVQHVKALEIKPINATTARDVIATYLTTTRRGFDENAIPATGADAERFARDLDGNGAVLAYFAGEPVAAGMYTNPLDGLTEVTGIATLPAYRRRGIATALTAAAVADAFARGVEIAFLTAADAQAGRVYERVGFRPVATALAYIDGQKAVL